MKLSKTLIKAHNQALEILQKDILTEDDKYFVLENWHEGANHVNSAAGAFFTPVGLARDFSLEVAGDKIIDLCAGIGGLAFAYQQKRFFDKENLEITCVEINPDYIEVGKKILPEANWIQASIFDIPLVKEYDCAISNPPFGNIPRHGKTSPRYTGSEFEYHVMDIAAHLADYGAFIIPQGSASFKFSGNRHYKKMTDGKFIKFEKKTGLTMGTSCGIDCDVYRDEWRGVSPAVEVVCIEFEDDNV